VNSPPRRNQGRTDATLVRTVSPKIENFRWIRGKNTQCQIGKRAGRRWPSATFIAADQQPSGPGDAGEWPRGKAMINQLAGDHSAPNTRCRWPSSPTEPVHAGPEKSSLRFCPYAHIARQQARRPRTSQAANSGSRRQRVPKTFIPGCKDESAPRPIKPTPIAAHLRQPTLSPRRGRTMRPPAADGRVICCERARPKMVKATIITQNLCRQQANPRKDLEHRLAWSVRKAAQPHPHGRLGQRNHKGRKETSSGIINGPSSHCIESQDAATARPAPQKTKVVITSG